MMRPSYPILGTLGFATVLVLGAASSGRARGDEAAAPRIEITSPRGGQTRERLVTVAGAVEGIAAERLTLVLNGVALSIPRSGETFSTPQVLAPGLNTIRVEAREEGRTVADEVSVYAMVPSKDLRITLTWDTPNTDVDLWVTGPDGEKVFYSNKQGKAGGTLDTDVTTGYGPETYTQARLEPGTYRVQAHYYSGAIPSRITVTVTRGEGTPEEERREFHAVLLKAEDVAEVGEFTVSG